MQRNRKVGKNYGFVKLQWCVSVAAINDKPSKNTKIVSVCHCVDGLIWYGVATKADFGTALVNMFVAIPTDCPTNMADQIAQSTSSNELELVAASFQRAVNTKTFAREGKYYTDRQSSPENTLLVSSQIMTPDNIPDSILMNKLNGESILSLQARS